ncbi:MAG TPA: Fe-S cluster assembly protein SufB [Acholeplasmataceae bacterium]|nr:Fe-S cluster assembly protein SufB [Acholeplasmataceae bacterium]
MNDIKDIIKDYKYGFSSDVEDIYNTGKGLNEEVVRAISRIKGEPDWMLEYRLQAYRKFVEMPLPSFGPKLDFINFDDYTYYRKVTQEVGSTWEEVPEQIKETFEKIGIPEAERKYLAGVSTQFESEVVYHNIMQELKEKGVLFCDTDTALRLFPDIFKEYFGTVVPYADNKFAALNSAVWSGGSFIYVPKGVKLDKPLQSYFRINSQQMGQFERTLIIVEDGASLHYVEGCTAPIYSKDSLHAAVVEIIVKEGGYCRYTTIQNWSTNVINLVTKRAVVEADGHMEWIDGNIGSLLNMKYPACILKGERAKGTTVSIAFAGEGQIQDAGAKMIHLAPRTTSTIISKSICRGGGKVNYRGVVSCEENAEYARSRIECDTIILDDKSTSDTIPLNVVKNQKALIEHEATVSKVSDDQLFYLMSRGLTESQALEMIVMGFIEPFARELPMEYAVELNRLIKLEMAGSIG